MIQEWFIWFFGKDLALPLGILITLFLLGLLIVGAAIFLTWVTKKI